MYDRFPVVDKYSGAAIKLSEVTFNYGPSQQPVFSDVTISAQCDSCIAVVSVNWGEYSASLLTWNSLFDLSVKKLCRHVFIIIYKYIIKTACYKL